MSAFTDALLWVLTILFVLTPVVDRLTNRSHSRRPARSVGFVAWLSFALFWAALVPTFFEMKSIVETILAAGAVPASLHAGYQLYNGRDSLFKLTSAIGAMAILYIPFIVVGPIRQFLIEMVTNHVLILINAVGYYPEVVSGPIFGYQSQYVYSTGGHTYKTYIELMCTGIGSTVILVGLLAPAKASLKRKLKILGVVVPLIYILNLVRNVFIALSFFEQWLQIAPQSVADFVGYSDPRLVSFFIADRIISQFLSAFVIAVLAVGLIMYFPNLRVMVQDLLYVATGKEFNLSRRDLSRE